MSSEISKVSDRIAELIPTFAVNATPDDVIAKVIRQVCRNAGMLEASISSAVKAAITTTKMIRLKTNKNNLELRKSYILEFINPMLEMQMLPSSAELKLRMHLSAMPMSAEYTEDIISEYYAQFNARYTFDIVVAVIDQMVSANKSESQIYNVVVTRSVADFHIDKASELYKRIETYIETQLQARQDGKITLDIFEFSPTARQMERLNRVQNAICELITYPGTGIPEIYNGIAMASSTGLISDEAGKGLWKEVKEQAEKAFSVIDMSKLSEDSRERIRKDTAFMREH